MDRQTGGHKFDFNTDVCTRCGMTRPQFEDNGSPPCRGGSRMGISRDEAPQRAKRKPRDSK